jgi:hypothetical protein
MKSALLSLISVSVVLVAVVLLSAMREVRVRALEPENISEVIAPLSVANDIELKKSKGKYKYKQEDPAEAQQGWTLAGEMPTAHNSFDTMGSVRVRGRRSGDLDTLDHTIPLDPTGVKGRDGTRFKQRFLYYSTERSEGHHRYPSWGFIKMWLEHASSSSSAEGANSENRLRFMYVVTKANEGGELVKTQYQDDIKQKVSEEKKVTGQTNLELGFQAGAESHDAGATAQYKAKKKGAKAKVL